MYMEKKIILRTNPNPHYQHFVHCMQYFYWVTDIILDDSNYRYIVMEPETSPGIYNYKSKYVVSYLKKISKVIPNFILTKKYDKNDIHRKIIYTWSFLQGNFILDNKKVLGNYLNWIPYNNSTKIRNLFFKDNNDNNIKIGLINRLKNRILLNSKKICDNIYNKFKIKVDIIHFEDKSFDYQINFFHEHKIIISPHGAQICSIPFAPKNALIIECVHEEWHPYDYFPGLSHACNKYHIMLCDNHTVFPQWSSVEYINKKRNKKLNITTDPKKIIDIIDIYLRNNNKLETYDCYLK